MAIRHGAAYLQVCYSTKARQRKVVRRKSAPKRGTVTQDMPLLLSPFSDALQLPDRATVATVARELRLLTITSSWEMV